MENLRQRGVALRTHHGFTTEALRRQVWSAQAECLLPLWLAADVSHLHIQEAAGRLSEATR